MVTTKVRPVAAAAPAARGPHLSPKARLAAGALFLFAFGLVLRLLFNAATPDGGPGWHIGFQGDAPVWQDLAARLAHGVQDAELVLPWRPPGMTYGIAAVWSGEGAGLGALRFSFAAMGALLAPLLWLLLRTHLPAGVAWLAALSCAAASNLLLLSSGLHSETPYLLAVAASLYDQQRLARPRAGFAALRWGVLHGLLCLLRAEHVLVLVAFAAVARVRGATLRTLGIALLAAAVPLVPWQLHANAMVAAYQRGAPPLPPSELPWRDDALLALREWPSFVQVPMHGFVTATMRVRGAEEVRAEDLEVVQQAFGFAPEPLRPAFVALQGGLALWLANTPEADGAFSRDALDRPPPLTGGPERYPPDFAAWLPRNGAFSLQHPMHLHAVVHGPALALREIAADPLGALVRVAKKCWYALEGAVSGVGGHALPIGLSGVRRPVDFVTATGAWPAVYRLLVLALAVLGCVWLRRVPALWPLFAFAAVRLFVVIAFFGHARHGALCLPLVAIGVAGSVVLAARRLRAERFVAPLAVLFAVLVLVLELARSGSTSVTVDGRPWLGPAGGVAQWRQHEITFR